MGNTKKLALGNAMGSGIVKGALGIPNSWHKALFSVGWLASVEMAAWLA